MFRSEVFNTTEAAEVPEVAARKRRNWNESRIEPSQDTVLHAKIRARAEKAAEATNRSDEVTGRIIHVLVMELSVV